MSPRAARPLVTVNAGGLSEGVFESELFGHVKGAFTDAKSRPRRPLRAGRRRHAVPRRDRERAARASRRSCCACSRPASSSGSARRGRGGSNVRMISATNADLNAEVAAGRFRQDLLFRLNTIEIHLPPLRERREDIPLLAQHFLRPARAALSQDAHRLRAGRDAALLEHRWPGNVRELDHAVERAVLMAQGELVRARDLGLRGRRRRRRAPRGHEPRGGRRLPDQEGAGALRQREPGREGARPEPQRALPAPRSATGCRAVPGVRS